MIEAEKLDQAAELLKEFDLDAWLIFVRETGEGGDPVLPYVLGHDLTWQSALLIERGGRRTAIVGSHDGDLVRSTALYDPVVGYVEGIAAPLREALERADPRALAVNWSTGDVKADGLTHGLYLLLHEHLAGTPFPDRLVSAERVVGALRGRKTAAELDRLRAALASTDEIFGEVTAFASPGTTEQAISRFMHDALADRGLGHAWNPAGCPIVTTGPDSMGGHGVPSPTLGVRPGAVFHLDFGVKRNGYCSDLQRSWYVPSAEEPEIPADVHRAFDAVHRSIGAAFDRLTPGETGWRVDEAARETLVAAGYPPYDHATGHHVGRAAHDGGGVLGPRWERYGRTPEYPLEVGNVVTLELGVDLPGRGYLGLEEMALVTEGGGAWLSSPQQEMRVLGA